MVYVYFLAVVVDVGVGFETVRATGRVLVAAFFPVMVFSTAWAIFWQNLEVCPKPRHLRHLVTTTKSSNLHVLQWSLIFRRATNSLRRFGLTSITTCLESSNVPLVSFMLSTGSSMWDRLFCWSIVSLIATSSTSLGTNMSSSVGSFLLGVLYGNCT